MVQLQITQGVEVGLNQSTSREYFKQDLELFQNTENHNNNIQKY